MHLGLLSLCHIPCFHCQFYCSIRDQFSSLFLKDTKSIHTCIIHVNYKLSKHWQIYFLNIISKVKLKVIKISFLIETNNQRSSLVFFILHTLIMTTLVLSSHFIRYCVTFVLKLLLCECCCCKTVNLIDDITNKKLKFIFIEFCEFYTVWMQTK